MSRKQSTTLQIAERIAKALIAEQTKARIALSFDAALIAANETFQMGPKRAQRFAQAYGEAMETLADLFVTDGKADEQLVYAKAKRDEKIRSIVGDEAFVPFDLSYGQACMDELRRIRIIENKELKGEPQQ